MFARILLAIEIVFATCIYAEVIPIPECHDSFIDTEENTLDRYHDWKFYGIIDHTVPRYFKKICREAEDQQLIIRIIIDTPGGHALSGYKLARLAKEYNVITIAGNYIGAHSAGAMWWSGSNKKEFESIGSVVSFHRAYIPLPNNEWSYDNIFLDIYHTKEDTIIRENFNVILSTLIIIHLDKGMDIGPQAIIEFQLTSYGVFINYFNGEKYSNIMLPNDSSLEQWHHYVEEDLLPTKTKKRQLPHKRRL